MAQAGERGTCQSLAKRTTLMLITGIALFLGFIVAYVAVYFIDDDFVSPIAFVIGTVSLILGVVCMIMLAINGEHDYTERCRQAGGVPIYQSGYKSSSINCSRPDGNGWIDIP